MNRKTVHLLLAFAVLLLGGELHSPIQQASLQRELQELQQRGVSVRFLDNATVEVSDPVSGLKRVKTLQEPREAQIRAWAAARGIPILEIDPTTIDTSRFTNWYRHWTQVPLSNGILGPLHVADFDRNGSWEVYGSFGDTLFRTYETRVYELDSIGQGSHFHTYLPRPGQSHAIIDVDGDSLSEVIFFLGGVESDFEQQARDSLPTRFNFSHNMIQGNASPGLTGIYVGSLDGDSSTDFLYQGSEPDSSDTTRGVVKTFVSEYDPLSNNFRRVWSQALFGALGGFTVDDFDLDAKKEFVASDLFGRVYVVENTSDNSYRLIMRDSLPFVNAYYQTSGDVDRDVYPEFFIGAVTNGYWLTMYEADSNNHYSPKFLFHLLSGGLYPTNLTADLHGDGRIELVVMCGRDLYIFRPDGDNRYRLWFLKREDRSDALGLWDFDRDGRLDFIISKSATTTNFLRLYADIYLATTMVSTQEPTAAELPRGFGLVAYPNPFNPSVTIEYELRERQMVRLSVFDILGREIQILVNEPRERGKHMVQWNGGSSSSGIYFLRIQTTSGVNTKKTILIR
jgi:hypothetical protein